MLERAAEILGYRFEDEGILTEALTHASIVGDRRESNERMEFLGDAILGFVVCDFLYRNYPRLLEGEMTKIKSSVVSRRVCAEVSEQIDLGNMLNLGKGMAGRPGLPSSVAAAVLESIIAAIFLDGGIDPARQFILEQMGPIIEDAARSTHQHNFKSALQQYAQKHLPSSPAYVLLDEKGPDHAKAFEVSVEIEGRRFGSAWANSKKEAEQKAALLALGELGLAEVDEAGEVTLTIPEEPDSTRTRTITLLIALLGAATAVAEEAEPVEADPAGGADAGREPAVRVGQLVYGDGESAVCFAGGFLETVDRRTPHRVEPEMIPVWLDDDRLPGFPLVVMTGQGAFELPDEQVEALRDYIDGGGFVLASAGCSDDEWAASFRGLMDRIAGEDEAFEALKPEHPVFHSITDIEHAETRETEIDRIDALRGLVAEGRLRVLFSPAGLNDAVHAGDGCCCCGGDEIRNARLIDANVLAYALSGEDDGTGGR